MTAAITSDGLQKRYGARTAVHGLDLEIQAGTIYGLIGPNGAGKTTTLRMLLDIIRPTAGSATVLGVDPRRGGPELRRRIGFVPGELRLEGRVRARHLLAHYADISGPVRRGSIETLASRLDLDLSRHVRALSKGNKQKVGLIQAFMHQPELLVLDEPTSGLDPLVQREFLSLVREARDNGQTVLLSSHVLSEIQQTADHVAVLSQGRIVAQGDVESLRLTGRRRVRAGVRNASVAGLGVALEAMPNVSDIELLDGDVVRLLATIEGDIDPLIKLLAASTVVDLAIEEPDLEDSVLALYGHDTEEADRA